MQTIEGQAQKKRVLLLNASRFEVRPNGASFLFEVDGPYFLPVPDGVRLPATGVKAARLACAHLAGYAMDTKYFMPFSDEAEWLADSARPFGAWSLRLLEFREEEEAGWLAVASFGRWEYKAGVGYHVTIRLSPAADLAGLEEMRLKYAWTWRVSLPRGFTPGTPDA